MLQDKQLTSPKVQTSKSKFWWWAKWVLTVLVLSYVYRTFENSKNEIRQLGNVALELFTYQNLPTLFLIIFLMPLNWMLESLKWKYLAQKAIDITYWEAFRSTLSGLAVGVALPAQLGDTIGRVTSLRSEKRLDTLGAAIVSNGIQFYVSITGGSISWLLFSATLPLSSSAKLSIHGLLILILTIGLVLGVFRSRLLNWSTTIPWVLRIKGYLSVISTYTNRELAVALAIGSARYVVFLIQFVLALTLFDLPIPVTALFGDIGLIFLVKTILPAINVIGDLGVRQLTALFVFESYNPTDEKIITVTFLIWLINVLGPILIGIYLVWKYKWSSKYAS